MASELYDPWNDRYEHLKQFPDHILLDIARNGAAELRYRLLAVEFLQRMNSPRAHHEDIQFLVRQLEIEMDGIPTEFEFIPIPVAPQPGPLTCSVTTATMFGEEKVENPENGQTGSSDSLLRSSSRNDDPECKRDVPREQKPSTGRKRNQGRTQDSESAE